MPTLLKIDVSPRGDHSISRKLSQQFAEEWQKAHTGGKIIIRDLATTNLPFVELPWISAAYSDPTTHNEEQKAALKIGDDLIAELKEADEYVIATPMYNFAVPARLKAFIDHVARAGKTFKVNPDGSYAGLLTGKKVTVIIASAGVYAPGTPSEGYDAEKPYLKAVLGFLGLTDITFVQAGGTYAVMSGKVTTEDFLAPFKPEVTAAARS
jgi:FMN-dependent NADH-azoreductase